MSGPGLKPFWRYYGAKWRLAPHYPKPEHDTIVEPFAGAAGYSLRYPDRKVFLIERYAVIAAIWRYLIRAHPVEILKIPEVQNTDDLPSWVPEEARYLVGFWMNTACTGPRKQLSAGKKRLALMGRRLEGWTQATRERIAGQLSSIRHWKIAEADYAEAPDVRATWFVDPPYEGAGRYYAHSRIDYAELAQWSRSRQGQVIVCENEGATWLPFRPFMTGKSVMRRAGSREAIFHHLT